MKIVFLDAKTIGEDIDMEKVKEILKNDYINENIEIKTAAVRSKADPRRKIFLKIIS